MEKKDAVIYCSRCGAEMKESSRYCMNCGNLNYDHPDNKNMRGILDKNNSAASYQVGSGDSIYKGMSNKGITQSIANNTGNKDLSFWINVAVFLLLILGGVGIAVLMFGTDILKIGRSFLPFYTLIVSVLYIFIYSKELFFMKMNRRWWAALIPIYNYFVLSEVIFKKAWLGILVLVPIVNIFYFFILFYKLGKDFGKNEITTAILPIVMIPIIGFGESTYQGRMFVADGKNAIEVEYKRKNRILTLMVLTALASIGLIIYSNIDSIINGGKDASKSRYSDLGVKFVAKTKEYIADGKVSCKKADYNSESGIYYFYLTDISKEVNKISVNVLSDPVEGYVKVVNVAGKSDYYVSVTDGETGYKLTHSSKVNSNVVKDFSMLDLEYEEGNECEFVKEES